MAERSMSPLSSQRNCVCNARTHRYATRNPGWHMSDCIAMRLRQCRAFSRAFKRQYGATQRETCRNPKDL
jgi:hypothetical protein